MRETLGWPTAVLEVTMSSDPSLSQAGGARPCGVLLAWVWGKIEGAVLLDPTVHIHFWISQNFCTSAGTISAEVRALEGAPSLHSIGSGRERAGGHIAKGGPMTSSRMRPHIL